SGNVNLFCAALKIPILFTHIDYPEKTNSLIALNAGPSNKLAGLMLSYFLIRIDSEESTKRWSLNIFRSLSCRE
ncbi:MAG TPA: hypothetical protein DE038_11885, partial [Nitrospina sp.]|nr:hypothetical protein [Nitrospina sp.]